MKHRCFSIFDGKALAYLPPFVMPEPGQAIRVFGDACNDAKHVFGVHPEDYTLFEIGFFDDRQGMLEPHGAPELVSTGLSLVKAAPADTQGSFFRKDGGLVVDDDEFLGES